MLIFCQLYQEMGRRQGNVFDRKEVMDLMQQRLDGSIKSLRELKDRIAEDTGEQIALTTLWQQIHKMRVCRTQVGHQYNGIKLIVILELS